MNGLSAPLPLSATPSLLECRCAGGRRPPATSPLSHPPPLRPRPPRRATRARAGAAWSEEFAGPSGAPAAGDWASEFASKLSLGVSGDGGPEGLEAAWGEVNDAWAAEFGEQQGGAAGGFAEWDELYDRHGAGAYDQYGGGGAEEYVFAAENPFRGDPEAYARGVELFKRGVLSEAARS